MNIYQTIKNNYIVIQNTGYLTIVECIRLVLPFVALPYIINTIGVEKYGMIAFAQSTMQYFILLINFGLDISAVRDVSIYRNDKAMLNKIVSSVLLIKLMLFVCSFIILLNGIFFFSYLRENFLLFLFSFLISFSEILFPVWFFQGIEKMKYITLVRTFSIIFYTSAIFTFMKSESDYLLVALFQSLGNVLAGIIAFLLLLYAEKINFIYPGRKVIKSYFVSSVPFFVSNAADILNINIAKTICGIYFKLELVAALDLAQRIAQFSIVPAQMLNQAVYPHIAKKQSRSFVRKYLYLNVIVAAMISLLVFLLAPIGVYYFAGDTMPQAVQLLRILSLFVFSACMTTYLGPILISFGHSGAFNKSILMSTLVLACCYFFFYSIGAFTVYSFALILFITQFSMLIYRLFYCYYYRIIECKTILRL